MVLNNTLYNRRTDVITLLRIDGEVRVDYGIYTVISIAQISIVLNILIVDILIRLGIVVWGVVNVTTDVLCVGIPQQHNTMATFDTVRTAATGL